MWRVLMELGQPVISKSHINNLDIELINGATIGLRGADRPDTMRGVSLNFLVLDEYADIKQETWEEILRPALADRKGDAIFIGTPKGRNWFYDLYAYASMAEDPEWKAWHFTSYDNPFLDEAEINRAKRSMSSAAFRQEFMASFESRGSELFKEDWIKFSEKEPEGSYYIAVDLAGFEELGKKNTTKNLDETAIAIVKVGTNGWYVKDIQVGRWDFNTTAIKIFEAVKAYKPIRVGIEKGIARQAIVSPLQDLMRRSGKFFQIQELTHGNQKKTDRIVFALQGKFENGWITLNKGEWNVQFLDQLYQFPDKLTHDDMVDALAYIDQMADESYLDLADDDLEDTFEPIDVVAGY